MSFDFSEYNQLAAELLADGGDGNPPSDCRCRCAISRAYYAALIYTRDRLEGNDYGRRPVRFDWKRIHSSVPEVLVGLKGDCSEYANALAFLRRQRNTADYDAGFGRNLPQAARDAVEAAGEIIDGIDEFADKHLTPTPR